MKIINTLITCSMLMISMPVLAMGDPEMDKVDMSPDRREAPPEGIDEAMLVEATATVTAVDMENRLVTIEGEDGNSVVILVTDQVKNLPQVEIGDKVDIKYYRSAAVDIVKLDKGEQLGAEMGAARATAPAGEKPAGAIAVEVRQRAEVMFVDPYQKYITFLSPNRGLRKISLKDTPELQHYLKELKKGDVIEVTYKEALAISLEPAGE
jgi:hypothetical protein